MATNIEDVVILNVRTGEAVKSVGELRDNIKEYKKAIETAEVGSETFRAAQKGLVENQNALRNAMHASTASMEDVAKDAQGMGTSYNALVANMAKLKEEFKATTDEVRRADLGEKINAINDQLKAMDAMQGNFQRNVGNYTQSVSDAFKDLAKDMPSFFGEAKRGVDDVSKSLALMGKQPIMGLVLLLAPVLTNIVEKLKENGTALEAIKKVGDALSPVVDALGKAVEWLADKLSAAADWFADLLGRSSDTFKAIISGAAGAGNVILQALVTPVKAAIEGVKGFGAAVGKIFKGDFKGAKQDAAAAAKGIGDAFRNGLAISANYDKGKEVAEQFMDGLGTTSRKKAREAGAAAAKEYKEAWREELDQMLEDSAAAASGDDEYAKEADAMMKAEENRLKIIQENRDKVAEIERKANDAVAKENEAFFKEQEEAQAKHAENMQKAWEASVAGTASILGSLADIYESTSADDVKAQKKAKALRIAEATINMLSGVVSAISQAQQLGPIAGPIAAAANAAAVTAAGLANIAKIRSTSLEGGSSSSASPAQPSTSTAAATIASQPVATPAALATLATDTQTLNAIGSQRVYILASDLEANDNARKVRVQETTF